MAITRAQIQSDSRLAFDDFPTETIVINGTTYTCLVLNYETASNWAVGGEIATHGLKILLDRDDISSMPEEGQSATFGSTTLRVANVERDDAAAPVVIDLTVPEV